jgi:hypothetical protein
MLAATVLHAHLNVIPMTLHRMCRKIHDALQQCPLCTRGSRVQASDVPSVTDWRQRGEHWGGLCFSSRSIDQTCSDEGAQWTP